jgi:hypothetical protein
MDRCSKSLVWFIRVSKCSCCCALHCARTPRKKRQRCTKVSQNATSNLLWTLNLTSSPLARPGEMSSFLSRESEPCCLDSNRS